MATAKQRWLCVDSAAGSSSFGMLLAIFVLTFCVSGAAMWGFLEYRKPVALTDGASHNPSSQSLLRTVPATTPITQTQTQTQDVSSLSVSKTRLSNSATPANNGHASDSFDRSDSGSNQNAQHTAPDAPFAEPHSLSRSVQNSSVMESSSRVTEQLQLHGTVVDQGGRGIPDADIRVVGDRVEKTRANMEGRFALTMQRALDGVLSVEVTHPHYESARRSVRVAAGRRSSPLLVELVARDRNVAVTGELSDMSGEPVPRSLLTLASTSSGFRYSMVSAPDGTFEFQSVGPAPDYTLQIASDGQYRKDVAKDIAVDGADLHLHLTAHTADVRGSLAVRFLDTLNRPMQGLTVVASSGAFGEIGWAKTDATGLAVVSDAPESQIVLRTSTGANCEIRSFTTDPDRARVDSVRLPRGDAVVGGRVTDTEQRPIANASVVVSTKIQTDQRRLWCVREAITDANGVYTMRSIGAGKKRIRFKARTYEPAEQSITVSAASGSSVHSVQLRRSAESPALTLMN